jgi:hypothetical protein
MYNGWLKLSWNMRFCETNFYTLGHLTSVVAWDSSVLLHSCQICNCFIYLKSQFYILNQILIAFKIDLM